MASVIETIIGMILLIGVLLVWGLLISGSVTLQTTRDAQLDRENVEQQQTNLALDAILASTENVSGQSIGDLIGETMLTLQTNMTFGNVTIDVLNATQQRLDAVFGPGNYYLTVKPVVKGVNLVFVVDPSPSVDAETQTIRDNLGALQQTILQSIRAVGDERVSIQVYMLPSTQSQCPSFESLGLPDTECQQLTETSLYKALLPLGWQRPSFGQASYDAWKANKYFADTSFFDQSDWAAGIATAALNFEQDSYRKSTVNLNLIFPLSDELATTSKADACFLKLKAEEWYVCQFCDGTCPIHRSEDAVNQTITILQNTTSTVFPIFTSNCDFQYDSGLNQLSSNPNPYVQSFNDNPGQTFPAYPAASWCTQTKCGGCTTQNGGVCFHRNCDDALHAQMAQLAQATGGSVLDINDTATLPTYILQAFQHATAAYQFSIGFKDERRERFAYEKVVALPNGEHGKVSLWVYRGQPLACDKDLPCTTPDGCAGVQHCVNQTLVPQCTKLNATCQGQSCMAPMLCLTSDDCMGMQACVNSTLSSLCVKSSPLCGPHCFNTCPAAGKPVCALIDGTNSSWIQVCQRGQDGCLEEKPVRNCQQGCRSNSSCNEDPVCPYNCSSTDGVCTPECSQNIYCPVDIDCPAQCTDNCRQDGWCNINCNYDAGCPIDPDCAINGAATNCTAQLGDTPPQPKNCCPTGTTWTWGVCENPASGFSQFPAVTQTYECGEGIAAAFGGCCSSSDDCTYYDGKINCLGSGETYQAPWLAQGSYLCDHGVMHLCMATTFTKACQSPYTGPACGVTISSVQYTCNLTTGAWTHG